MSDVPGKYDVKLGGLGYMFDESFDPSVVYKTQKASYSFTPTFIERQNVSGDFGDNQQDFWMTLSQRDWSGGEGQAHFKSQDPDSSSRYLVGENVGISTSGEVQMALDVAKATAASALFGAGVDEWNNMTYTSTSANLITVDASGFQTSLGAHGAGAEVTAYAADGTNMFFSGPACTSTRKVGLLSGVVSAFSATPMDSLVFLNNTLYGANGGTLYSLSTAGVATSQFQFKDATGTAYTTRGKIKLAAFGGRIAVLKRNGSYGACELFLWDGGVTVSKVAEFPSSFSAFDFCVNLGTIYVSGNEMINPSGGGGIGRVAVYSYDGSLGVVYRTPGESSFPGGVQPPICAWGDGFALGDHSAGLTNGSLRIYSSSTGAISSVASGLINGPNYLAAAPTFILMTGNQTATQSIVWPGVIAAAPTANLYTSRFDFESSLEKIFHSVTVQFDPGFDGDGGSVDLGYYTTDPQTVTSIATGVASGVEQQFPTLTGNDVGIVVTLHKGTSTLGPVLRRVYARATPVQRTFKYRTYILNLSGNRNNPTQPGLVVLRDGSTCSRDGLDMATDLIATVTSGQPFQIEDRFGSFTGVAELGSFELHEVRSNYGRSEFRAIVTVRQV